MRNKIIRNKNEKLNVTSTIKEIIFLLDYNKLIGNLIIKSFHYLSFKRDLFALNRNRMIKLN